MIEWEAASVVVGASPFGEADAIVAVLTEEHGLCRGLVRGASSRRHRATWEAGNVLRVHWRGRLADQLGSFTGEVVASPFTTAIDRPVALALLASVCAVTREALPERTACGDLYRDLLLVLARLSENPPPLPLLVRWEVSLLADLGFGLSLDRCIITGVRDGLAFVSPRTGCAVTRSAARGWEERVLRLPRFVLDPDADAHASTADWADGLQLTGHFLARDVFASHHRALPMARSRLADMVARSGPASGDAV